MTIIYKQGLELINIIKNERIAINNANNEMSKLNMNKKENDFLEKEKIARKRCELDEILVNSFNDYQLARNKFFALKSNCSENEWRELLMKLGFTMASTENIKHVGDNLHDELLLEKAIESTIYMVRNKETELIRKKRQKKMDDIILLEAELAYYKNDLNKHFLGTLALEKFYNGEKLKR